MKSALVTTLLVLAPVAGTQPACATQPVTSRVDDGAITTRVGTRLAADPDIKKAGIDVDTLDHVVTLRGTVRSEEMKNEAEQIAMHTRGVDSVVNLLEVGPRPKGAERRSDAWITTKIKSQLMVSLDTRARDVHVDTDRHVVTLSGKVRDDEAKRVAERIARGTEGVDEVINELTVASR